MKSKVFKSGTKSVKQMGTMYYHGSDTEIIGNVLQPKKQKTHDHDKIVNAVFLSPDITYSKLFAIRKCIGGDGEILITFNDTDGKNRIYLNQLSKHIKPYFYIYSAKESKTSPFIRDSYKEYYSLSPVDIIEKKKLSVVKELSKLNCEVYILDEPIKDHKVGKHHRVDLKDIISNQPGNSVINTIRTMADFIRY
ncbi:MAG: hypothetical protein IKZ49_02365 [Alphaproteobacteria bacterium]|nr:hypothetical protein [Alphaproteobacteria bacterium]